MARGHARRQDGKPRATSLTTPGDMEYEWDGTWPQTPSSSALQSPWLPLTVPPSAQVHQPPGDISHADHHISHADHHRDHPSRAVPSPAVTEGQGGHSFPPLGSELSRVTSSPGPVLAGVSNFLTISRRCHLPSPHLRTVPLSHTKKNIP